VRTSVWDGEHIYHREFSARRVQRGSGTIKMGQLATKAPTRPFWRHGGFEGCLTLESHNLGNFSTHFLWGIHESYSAVGSWGAPARALLTSVGRARLQYAQRSSVPASTARESVRALARRHARWIEALNLLCREQKRQSFRALLGAQAQSSPELVSRRQVLGWVEVAQTSASPDHLA
jgi:hypothetical protein